MEKETINREEFLRFMDVGDIEPLPSTP